MDASPPGLDFRNDRLLNSRESDYKSTMAFGALLNKNGWKLVARGASRHLKQFRCWSYHLGDGDPRRWESMNKRCQAVGFKDQSYRAVKANRQRRRCLREISGVPRGSFVALFHVRYACHILAVEERGKQLRRPSILRDVQIV